MAKGDLCFTGVKILLTVVFLHRCVTIYDRWSLERTETFHYSQAMTELKPVPAFTFKRIMKDEELVQGEDLLGDFVTRAKFYNGNSIV